MVETGMAGTKSVSRLDIGRVLTWILLIFLIIITLFPLWIVLKTALTPKKELFNAPLALFP